MGDTERIVQQEKLENEDLELPKSPRRIIHFSSGETMEEYSTEEEEDDAAAVEFHKVDTLLHSIKPKKIIEAAKQSTTIPKKLMGSLKKKGRSFRRGTL